MLEIHAKVTIPTYENLDREKHIQSQFSLKVSMDSFDHEKPSGHFERCELNEIANLAEPNVGGQHVDVGERLQEVVQVPVVERERIDERQKCNYGKRRVVLDALAHVEAG